VEDIAASLDVTVGSDDGEPIVYVRLLDSTTGFGFDGSQGGAIRAVDEMVPLLAENARGDRWIAGEGWRDYRPEMPIGVTWSSPQPPRSCDQGCRFSKTRR
jgi:hypothetical protein